MHNAIGKFAQWDNDKDFYQQLDLYERRKVRVYRYLISSAVDGSVGPLGRPLSLPPREKSSVRRKEKKLD